VTTIPPEKLFKFPCDHLFKVFGPNDGEFAEEVRSAVSGVTPVALDAMRLRPSAGGAHQCVSFLLHVYNYPQLLLIYSVLKQLPRLRYLL